MGQEGESAMEVRGERATEGEEQNTMIEVKDLYVGGVNDVGAVMA